MESISDPAVKENRVTGLEGHTLLIRPDGSELPVDDSASPIHRGGTIVGGVLIFRDIAVRRQAELLLEYSESQFRTTFPRAPLGMVLTGVEDKFYLLRIRTKLKTIAPSFRSFSPEKSIRMCWIKE
ncbi:MAG TPA: hypothetical protein VEX68_20410 [Bryobacteraceae bacterium]|nr:hypothetical protein [Bryobacteraceae bacterium]